MKFLVMKISGGRWPGRWVEADTPEEAAVAWAEEVDQGSSLTSGVEVQVVPRHAVETLILTRTGWAAARTGASDD